MVTQKQDDVKEIPIKTGEKMVRNDKGQFIEGHEPMGGRPRGVRDFTTDFEEAIKELAEEQGITFSEARKDLLKVAYRKAKEGNFPYHKDIMDRYYGEETDKGQINIDIEQLVVKFNKILP